MADPGNQDVAPEDTGEPVEISPTKGRRAFSNLRRELTDDELSSPAVQRLLLDDIERLEKENGRLGGYQDLYYAADKNAAVLREKLKTHVALEVIFGVCLTIGAALMGYAPSLWSSEKADGQIALGLGVILIIGSIVSKLVEKR